MSFASRPATFPAQAVDWPALMHELGPRFAARAADYDAGDAFVAENFDELKARGVFAAAVPARARRRRRLLSRALRHAARSRLLLRLDRAHAVDAHAYRGDRRVALAARSAAGRRPAPARRRRPAAAGRQRRLRLAHPVRAGGARRGRLAGEREEDLRQRQPVRRSAADAGGLRRSGRGPHRVALRDPARPRRRRAAGHLARARHARDRIARRGHRERVRAGRRGLAAAARRQMDPAVSPLCLHHSASAHLRGVSRRRRGGARPGAGGRRASAPTIPGWSTWSARWRTTWRRRGWRTATWSRPRPAASSRDRRSPTAS